jgi:hypothetical protein
MKTNSREKKNRICRINLLQEVFLIAAEKKHMDLRKPYFKQGVAGLNRDMA